MATVWLGIGPDHATPTTLAPARNLPAGPPSAAAALYISTSPLTAMASCFPSGLHARPSGCCSLEFTRVGPVTAAVAEGCVEAAGEADPLGFTVGLGDAIGSPLLIGSIRAPGSGSATAAGVPSGRIASGPSSGPSGGGNGVSPPRAA